MELLLRVSLALSGAPVRSYEHRHEIFLKYIWDLVIRCQRLEEFPSKLL